MLDRRIPLVDGTIDLGRREILRGTEVVSLTQKETEVIELLANAEGEAVSRETIHRDVFGYTAATRTRAADDIVKTLRKKLERDTANPVHLLTVRGLGYRFEPAEDKVVVGGMYGRGTQLAAVHRALREGRSMTIVGLGGIGKTTLARAVAEGWTGEAVFLDVTHLQHIDEVSARAADLLGVQMLPGDTVARLSTVGRAMAERQGLLVVVDNAESVPDAVVDCVWLWRDLAPDTRFVITSRTPLSLEGEVMELGPLEPDDALELAMQHVEGDEERARQLVDTTGGYPLALVLSSARAATPLPRSASIEAVIAWSFDHLEPSDQQVALATAVFADGFDLAAAGAVTGGAPPISSLRRLGRHNLLLSEASEDGLRHRHLPPVQQFLAQKLRQHPDLERTARDRHATHYAGWGWEKRRMGQLAAQTLRRELANLRQARRWALEHAPSKHLSLALAIHASMRMSVTSPESIQLLEEALAIADGANPERVAIAKLMLLQDRWMLGGGQRDVDGLLALANECRDTGLWRIEAGIIEDLALEPVTNGFDGWTERVHDTLCRVQSLDESALQIRLSNAMGQAQVNAGRYAKALASFESSLALAREHQAQGLIPYGITLVGSALFYLRRFPEALETFEAIAKHEQARQDLPSFVSSSQARAWILAELGRLDQAMGLFDETMALLPGGHGAQTNARAHLWRALALHKMGRPKAASAEHRAARTLIQGMSTPSTERWLLLGPPLLEALGGHHDRAATLLEAVLALVTPARLVPLMNTATAGLAILGNTVALEPEPLDDDDDPVAPVMHSLARACARGAGEAEMRRVLRQRVRTSPATTAIPAEDLSIELHLWGRVALGR